MFSMGYEEPATTDEAVVATSARSFSSPRPARFKLECLLVGVMGLVSEPFDDLGLFKACHALSERFQARVLKLRAFVHDAAVFLDKRGGHFHFRFLSSC
jgi:hypothetical protein